MKIEKYKNILLELDPDNDMKIKKTYIYANSQILAEHNGSYSAPRYFYLHDRLGSVRQVINQNGDVVRFYTYNPYGELLESGHESQAPSNDFMFTGQYLDSETGHYYLRARQYSPYLSRFITRDLIDGEFESPLSLHKYLYCQNEPINHRDLNGKWTIEIHRHFGFHGYGYDEERREKSIFDYGRLDIDKPAIKRKYRPLHFRSRKDIYPDIVQAAFEGNIREYEYLMHQWQDSYVHFDRGYRGKWGHWDPSVDFRDDPTNVANRAWERCYDTTRILEDMWFRFNPDTVELTSFPVSDSIIKGPWLAGHFSWINDEEGSHHIVDH